MDRLAAVSPNMTNKGKVMRIVNALLRVTRFASSAKKVTEFLGNGAEGNARMPDEGEEMGQQQLQLRADIQQAFEDIRRQEYIMRQIEHDNGDELRSN